MNFQYFCYHTLKIIEGRIDYYHRHMDAIYMHICVHMDRCIKQGIIMHNVIVIQVLRKV